jgi:hypothetical protein
VNIKSQKIQLHSSTERDGSTSPSLMARMRGNPQTS